MTELCSTAERLRQAREASREFLNLWAVSGMDGKADWLDRVAADVERASVAGASLFPWEQSAPQRGRFSDDQT